MPGQIKCDPVKKCLAIWIGYLTDCCVVRRAPLLVHVTFDVRACGLIPSAPETLLLKAALEIRAEASD